jgi:hypothetical protein
VPAAKPSLLDHARTLEDLFHAVVRELHPMVPTHELPKVAALNARYRSRYSSRIRSTSATGVRRGEGRRYLMSTRPS